jgi:predicted nuclease of predicted toxin-antitoxin system
LKFLLDMGISPKTGTYLAELGYDTTHLIKEHMETASDSEILNKALHEKRIILTHDLDFGKLLATAGTSLLSVVIFRLKNMRLENVNRFCAVIIDRFADVLEKGAILSVGDKRIRCHLLPISK